MSNRDLSAADASPAAAILDELGVSRIATYTGRAEATVRRWPASKAKGGSDGLIPMDNAVEIVRGVVRDGVPFRLERFFPPDLVAQLDWINEQAGERQTKESA